MRVFWGISEQADLNGTSPLDRSVAGSSFAKNVYSKRPVIARLGGEAENGLVAAVSSRGPRAANDPEGEARLLNCLRRASSVLTRGKHLLTR